MFVINFISLTILIEVETRILKRFNSFITSRAIQEHKMSDKSLMSRLEDSIKRQSRICHPLWWKLHYVTRRKKLILLKLLKIREVSF